MSALERELSVARAAGRRAAEAVMTIYGTDFAVAFKDAAHDDPVTAADRQANAIIVDAIHAAFPDDFIVAEESAIPSGFERGRRCWFVDPLDGTKEFVAKNGEFCVMIGLAVDGRAALGVVVVPALDGGYLLEGRVGVGATLDDARGIRSVHVTAESEASRARVVVSRSRRPPLLDAVFAELGAPREVACGSVGVKIGKLVTGDADAYLHPASARRDGGSKRWDVCAPEAIVVAAGGAFTDGLGNPIDYASPDVVNRDGLVVSNGVLHARLLQAIANAHAK